MVRCCALISGKGEFIVTSAEVLTSTDSELFKYALCMWDPGDEYRVKFWSE